MSNLDSLLNFRYEDVIIGCHTEMEADSLFEHASWYECTNEQKALILLFVYVASNCITPKLKQHMVNYIEFLPCAYEQTDMVSSSVYRLANLEELNDNVYYCTTDSVRLKRTFNFRYGHKCKWVHLIHTNVDCIKKIFDIQSIMRSKELVDAVYTQYWHNKPIFHPKSKQEMYWCIVGTMEYIAIDKRNATHTIVGKFKA